MLMVMTKVMTILIEVNLMTKFETVGVQFQHEAVTKEEAVRSFQYSCRVCSERGIRIDCDRCCIASTHAVTIAAIETREEMDRKKDQSEDNGEGKAESE